MQEVCNRVEIELISPLSSDEPKVYSFDTLNINPTQDVKAVDRGLQASMSMSLIIEKVSENVATVFSIPRRCIVRIWYIGEVWPINLGSRMYPSFCHISRQVGGDQLMVKTDSPAPFRL